MADALRGTETSEPRFWGLSALGVWKGWSEDQNLGGSGRISGGVWRSVSLQPGLQAAVERRARALQPSGRRGRLHPDKVSAE